MLYCPVRPKQTQKFPELDVVNVYVRGNFCYQRADFGLKMDQLVGVFSLLCVRTEGQRSKDLSPFPNCFACVTEI